MAVIGFSGGRLRDAIALGDGSLLIAQGDQLRRILPDQNGATVSLTEPGYGPILQIRAGEGVVYALAGRGLITLDGVGGAVLALTPGGGERFDLGGGWLAVAAAEAGVRLYRLDESGVPRFLAEVPPGISVRDVLLDPSGGRVFAATSEGVLVIPFNAEGVAAPGGFLPGVPGVDRLRGAGALLAAANEDQVFLVDPNRGAGALVGGFAPLRGGRRIAVQEDFLFAADGRHGLKVFWLAAPDRPVQVYGELNRPALDLFVDGTLAYLVGPEGLRVVDTGNRYRPLNLAELRLPGSPQGITLSDERAFVALGEEGLGVVGLSNLAAPTLLTRIPFDSPVRAVEVVDGWAYVALDRGGLAVVDAREAGRERVHSTLGLGCPALDLARRGDALYAACGEGGLVSLDIIRRESPLLVEGLPAGVGQSFSAITIEGKRAFVAHQGEGFSVIDVSRPDRMGRLADLPGPAEGLAVSGITLYTVADQALGVYDIRATAEPLLIRNYSGIGGINSLTVDGNRLFLTGDAPGSDLVILDLSSPASPVELENVPGAGGTVSAAVFGDRVWALAADQGLLGGRISSGGALTGRAWLTLTGDAAVLSVDGDLALIGGRGGWSGGRIRAEGVDLLTGGREPVQDLALSGDRAALLTGDGRVLVAGLIHESRWEISAEGEAPLNATGIALEGETLVLSGPGGLTFYDPRFALPILSIDTPAPAVDVALHGGRAYAPLTSGGLAVVEVGALDGGIRTLSSIETRRPAVLIPGPDGRSVFTLSENGMLRLDVSRPEALQVIDRGNLPDPVTNGLFLNGLLAAYSAEGPLILYDVGDLEMGAAAQGVIPLAPHDLLIEGRIAYVAYGEGGFGTADISRPGSEVRLTDEAVFTMVRAGERLISGGSRLRSWEIESSNLLREGDALDLPAFVTALAVGENGLILAGLERGLALVRIEDDGRLTLLGTLLTAEWIEHVAGIGSMAFLAAREGGLIVVDLSDPAGPRRLLTTTSALGQFPADLYPLDDSSLLVSWEGGITALDISQIGAGPRLLAVADLAPDSPRTLHIGPAGDQAVLTYAGGVALLDLSDPTAPAIQDTFTTPGDGTGAILQGDRLFAADGLCGVRALDLNGRESGYWRGVYASDIAVLPDGDLLVADAAGLVRLRYLPEGDAIPPALPAQPVPVHGSDENTLLPTLSWGPEPDPCDGLRYDLYLGTGADPAQIAQGLASPSLALSQLEPLRTYYWRVEAVDRQGERRVGPTWQFTTLSADITDSGPQVTANFLAALLENPGLPLSLILLMVAGSGYGYWRWQSGRRKRTGNRGQQDSLH